MSTKQATSTTAIKKRVSKKEVTEDAKSTVSTAAPALTETASGPGPDTAPVPVPVPAPVSAKKGGAKKAAVASVPASDSASTPASDLASTPAPVPAPVKKGRAKKDASAVASDPISAPTPAPAPALASDPVSVSDPASVPAPVKKGGAKKDTSTSTKKAVTSKKKAASEPALTPEPEPESAPIPTIEITTPMSTETPTLISTETPTTTPSKRRTHKKSSKVTDATKGGKRSIKREIIKREVEDEEAQRTRFFKVIVGGGEPHGRFSGNKPKQAANKALTSILKTLSQTSHNSNESREIKFSIIECTRNSKHKQYNYVGQRIRLENPMKVTIGKGIDAKVIEYKFNNRVMKDKTAIVEE